MKKCPYCGKEYPDDATVCIVDTEVLVEHPPKPKVVEVEPLYIDEQPANAKPVKAGPYLTYPNYQWSARDAWKCLGMIVVLMFFVLSILDYGLFSIFPNFFRTGSGFVCRRIFFFATWVITACYFARTETVATFLRGFGFDRKPTHYAWFGMSMALILRFASHFMYVHGWGKGAYSYEIDSTGNAIGFQKLLFQFSPLVLAPVFEEAVNRGFLYKAFRKSYPMAVSITIMVAWTCYTHWSYYYESWIAAVNLSAWTVL